ncbi:hypothetical protein Pmar_PMAR006100 [Perkinsus marinus ATCC 50983]|uniref:K Homology domain-containing protein n=1 Tax=Perkinsus marinus (strain ATCC 50983 / TXsc) TaxID=423536 RepID=C5LA77_PERM5|nr:hypothetical protein Pmar_PMAR006100 [Perkinsus marinus ATCC 50983]EER06333.1 hypothetical protein Pmar_PMAR006100 [Perkinsus marinus ATCC 50983]|eukprot:XP_002774517.1 hypothetical protein Pmar_PMAR006100 [Perkinsus marinus ATCC 50983]
MPSFESPRHYNVPWPQCPREPRKRSLSETASHTSVAEPKRPRTTSVSAAAAAAVAAAQGLVQAPRHRRASVAGHPVGLGALAQQQRFIAEMGGVAGSFEEPYQANLFTRQVVCHEDLIGRVIGVNGVNVKRIEANTSYSQAAVDDCAACIEQLVTNIRQEILRTNRASLLPREAVLVVPGFIQSALIGPRGCVLRTIEHDSSTRIQLDKGSVVTGRFDDQMVDAKYGGHRITIKGADYVSLGLAAEYIALVIIGRYPIDFAMHRFMSGYKMETYRGMSVEESLVYRQLPLEWLDHFLQCSDSLKMEQDKMRRSLMVRYTCELREKYFISSDLLKWSRINRKVISFLSGHMMAAQEKGRMKTASPPTSSGGPGEISVIDDKKRGTSCLGIGFELYGTMVGPHTAGAKSPSEEEEPAVLSVIPPLAPAPVHLTALYGRPSVFTTYVDSGQGVEEPGASVPGPGAYDVPLDSLGCPQVRSHWRNESCVTMTAKNEHSWSRVFITKMHAKAVKGLDAPGAGTYDTDSGSLRCDKAISFALSRRPDLSTQLGAGDRESPGPGYVDIRDKYKDGDVALRPRSSVRFSSGERFRKGPINGLKVGPGEYGDVGESAIDPKRMRKSFSVGHRAYDK